MEAAIECNHAHRLLFARLGHDGLLADAATRRKLLVEVLDAVDLAVGRDGEGDVVQHFGANLASEAVWVEGLAGSSEDSVDNGPLADAALLERVQVVVFAVGLLLRAMCNWIEVDRNGQRGLVFS